MMVAKVSLTMSMEIVTPLPGVTAEKVADKFGDAAKEELVAELRKEMEGLAVASGARITSVAADVTLSEV